MTNWGQSETEHTRGTSPRTVNKHLEHVFEKLGVETRTAAANVAMARIGGQA